MHPPIICNVSHGPWLLVHWVVAYLQCQRDVGFTDSRKERRIMDQPVNLVIDYYGVEVLRIQHISIHIGPCIKVKTNQEANSSYDGLLNSYYDGLLPPRPLKWQRVDRGNGMHKQCTCLASFPGHPLALSTLYPKKVSPLPHKRGRPGDEASTCLHFC